jgi:hypothetical protein
VLHVQTELECFYFAHVIISGFYLFLFRCFDGMLIEFDEGNYVLELRVNNNLVRVISHYDHLNIFFQECKNKHFFSE